jgi:hypothetical protein
MDPDCLVIADISTVFDRKVDFAAAPDFSYF